MPQTFVGNSQLPFAGSCEWHLDCAGTGRTNKALPYRSCPVHTSVLLRRAFVLEDLDSVGLGERFSAQINIDIPCGNQRVNVITGSQRDNRVKQLLQTDSRRGAYIRQHCLAHNGGNRRPVSQLIFQKLGSSERTS